MTKPKLAILTESIRFDNQDALKYFSKIEPVHFYQNTPYGDLKPEELQDATQYKDIQDLEQKLIDLKPDIIQGAEPYASRKQLELCRVAIRISKKFNIPLIFPTLENRPVNARFGFFIGLAVKNFLKKYAKHAKLIFYLNNGAKRNLLQVGTDPKKMVRLLYGIWGVDTSIYRPLTDYRLQTTVKNKILFIGRIDEAKGIPYLVEAWKKIASEFPNIEFDFAGTGVLENLIEGDRMHKLGMVKNTDLPNLINQALFVVYPSVTLKRWEEQVGTVNLQALACGVPVITTKSGAIPEYINDEVGILVSERNTSELAEAMRKLLSDDELRHRLGVNGRRYILEHFDAAKTVHTAENLILKLLSK